MELFIKYIASPLHSGHHLGNAAEQPKVRSVKA